MKEFKDPFDSEGNFILTDAEVNTLLERYDKTPAPLQRQIVASFVMRSLLYEAVLKRITQLQDEMDGASFEETFLEAERIAREVTQ